MVLKPILEKKVSEIEVGLLARALSGDLPPLFEDICSNANFPISLGDKARSLGDLSNEASFEEPSAIESSKSESSLSDCSFNFDSDRCESSSPVEQPDCGKAVLTSSGAADCSLFNRALQMMPCAPACEVKALVDGSCRRAAACIVFNRALEQNLPNLPTPCLIKKIAGKGIGMLALRKLYPGDLIVAEKPVLTMPRAVFDSDRQSTEDWLSKAINLLGSEDKELLLSLTDCCNPEDDNVTYIGLLYTNCMSWEGDVVVCPLVATANHSCRPNAQFVPRLDKGVNELRATYVIEEGEEVNISYLAMTREGGESWVARQRELMRGYGFFCTCQACSLEGPQLDTEEELRENLKQLQARGAQNWVKEEVSEYLEGMSQLQGNPSHILGVLDICFHASKDQVVLFHRNN